MLQGNAQMTIPRILLSAWSDGPNADGEPRMFGVGTFGAIDVMIRLDTEELLRLVFPLFSSSKQKHPKNSPQVLRTLGGPLTVKVPWWGSP